MPLADVMFQLLIFFMLSTGLTPYSLLTLQSGPGEATAQPAGGGAATGAPPAQPGVLQPGEAAIWRVEADAVIAGGQRFGFDDLEALAGALGSEGAPARVVLVVGRDARVQDISTVLARLKAADVGSVQLSTGGA